MFTGIVTDVGEVVAVAPSGEGKRFAIACRYLAEGIALGASIACGGPCLTVTSLQETDGSTVFTVDVSTETLARTTAGAWQAGTRLNLERSLKIGDELGGHIVTGHVDGVAEIVGRIDEVNFAKFRVRAPSELSRFIAEKGSVALDGVSLTVNKVDGAVFELMLIPHTLAVTTFGVREVGSQLNLEVDLMARYAARLAEAR